MPLMGYPTSFGNKRVSCFEVTGPSSYTQYTAPTTGGQDVQLFGPSGVKVADVVLGGVSKSGLYRADVVQIEASTLNGVPVALSRAILKWYVVATGSEVAGAFDLDAETVVLTVIGPI